MTVQFPFLLQGSEWLIVIVVVAVLFFGFIILVLVGLAGVGIWKRAGSGATQPRGGSAPPAATRFCTYCGGGLVQGARFCPYCGKQVS